MENLTKDENKVKELSQKLDHLLGDEGTAIALQIDENKELKEHITKVPALLICLKGEALFSNEKGVRETLLPGDFVNIEPMIKHKVNAILNSSLILIK